MVGRVSYAYQCAICPLPTVTKIVQSTGAYKVNSQTMRSVMQLDTNDVCTSWLQVTLLVLYAVHDKSYDYPTNYHMAEGRAAA